ncbi:MAG TPA: hypothetical protein VFH92_12105 [Phenylobacterium sp.]|nr:hypothetical protein [Phenylobacterium sp.]
MRHAPPSTFIGLLAKLARILRARYLVVLTVILGAVLGGLIVIATSPKLYQGRARVVLDLVKLDEQTGSIISKDFEKPYVESQLNLLRDSEVTGRVAEEMGWLQNPDYIAEYNNRPPGDDRDMRTWAGDRLAQGISGTLLPDSNVLEISYRTVQAEPARLITDAIRRAYMEASLQSRRDSAQRQREWFTGQGEILRKQLEVLISQREELQRVTGVVLQDDKEDIETARLKRIASLPEIPLVSRDRTNPLWPMRLVELDTQIAQLTPTAGPNNPQLVELRKQRSIIAAQMDAERRDNAAELAREITATQSIAADMQVLRQKVGSESEELAALHQIQDHITVLQNLYDKVMERAEQLHQTTNVNETELVPVGSAEADQGAYFPNPPLILGGTAGLGAVLGATLALFLELLSRRVRGVTDLAAATDAPVLGTIRLKASGDERVRPGKAPKPAKARAARKAKDPRTLRPGKGVAATRVR